MEFNFVTTVKAGITQGEVAQLVGVSRNTVSKWMHGTGGVRLAHAETVKLLLDKLNRAIEDNQLPLPHGVRRKNRLRTIREILDGM